MPPATIILRDRGPRLYILSGGYGIRGQLKAAGAQWDGVRRQWWAGKSRRSAIEQAITAAGETFTYIPEGIPFRGVETKVIGSAMHGEELHYVIWAGEKDGRLMKKIVARDASSEKWLPDGEAPWVKQYKSPKVIRDLQNYAAMMENARAGQCPRCADSPEPACPICAGITAAPKAPLFLAINNFAKNMDAKHIGRQHSLPSLGRPWPTVHEIKGIKPDGDFDLIEVPRVNFDIRHISKNGKHGVRMFYSLPGGRIYLAREHENYSKYRIFIVHATSEGAAITVSSSWAKQALQK